MTYPIKGYNKPVYVLCNTKRNFDLYIKWQKIPNGDARFVNILNKLEGCRDIKYIITHPIPNIDWKAFNHMCNIGNFQDITRDFCK